MAENTNRSIFALDGITGMLIATALLLSILAGLTAWGISAQQNNADKFYKIQDEKSIKMIDKEAAKHWVNVQ
jgi:hypothetical protein